MKKEESFAWCSPQDLRLGMYVSLDVGWLAHPFPTGNFKISAASQLDTLRSLGLARIRYIPAKSDPLASDPSAIESIANTPVAPAGADPESALAPIPGTVLQQAATPVATAAALASAAASAQQTGTSAQQQAMAACEARFSQTAQQYQDALGQVQLQPALVAQQCQAMVSALVDDVAGLGEVAVRLLPKSAAEPVARHAVNVTVLSLLLGKAVDMSADDLKDLSLAAFLHDIGKVQLPAHLQWASPEMPASALQHYESHVVEGVRIAKAMGLSSTVMQTMLQHHELMDGSGFPQQTSAADLPLASRILALVNQYDALCNSAHGSAQLTPHEALARMFSLHKGRYDGTLLSVFIRMMGVYPPGSVVQLADDRYAMVVSVNSSRPLKPRVMVFDAKVPATQAAILDLEQQPGLGVRRSLKPLGLPDTVRNYLAPPPRMAYFYEPAVARD